MDLETCPGKRKVIYFGYATQVMSYCDIERRCSIGYYRDSNLKVEEVKIPQIFTKLCLPIVDMIKRHRVDCHADFLWPGGE